MGRIMDNGFRRTAIPSRGEGTDMLNCSLFKFRDITDGSGHLTAIEGASDIPFDIRRVYYITRVETGVTRGFHSHRRLHQVLLCLNGSVQIRLKNPQEEEVILLSDPSVGLYIGPNVWREMYDFAEGSVLLVLASDHYSEDDYVRDYELYLKEAGRIY